MFINVAHSAVGFVKCGLQRRKKLLMGDKLLYILGFAIEKCHCVDICHSLIGYFCFWLSAT